MARNSIIFTARGPAVYRNVRKDLTGEPLLLLDEDEVKTLVLDFASYVETSETISSATASAENVSCSISTTSPRVTLTLSAATSNSDGKVTVVVTFSTANKWRGIIRVRRAERFDAEVLESDYA